MLTHTRNIRYSTDEGRLTDTDEPITGDGEQAYDGVIPTSGTPNVEVDLAFPFANVKSMVIYSAQAMTIKSNSTSVPDDTFTVPAGKQLAWNTNDIAACPFTVDVTKLYLTNGSATLTSIVKIRILLDVTP